MLDWSAASFDGAFRRVNRIETKWRTLRALTTLREIFSHLVHSWAAATENAGTLSIDPDMMVARTHQLAQIHNVEIPECRYRRLDRRRDDVNGLYL